MIPARLRRVLLDAMLDDECPWAWLRGTGAVESADDTGEATSS